MNGERETDYEIDWAKYPKVAATFEHRPNINVYSIELLQLLRDARADAVQFIEDVKSNELKKARQHLHNQVMEFHAVMGVPIGVAPTLIPDERVRLRAALILEECIEALDAMFWAESSTAKMRSFLMQVIAEARIKGDLVELADALADIDYVVEGARIEFGIDGGPIADEVHRSNMAKVGGPVSPTGKKLKPPGWTPPNIAACLEDQGWKRP